MKIRLAGTDIIPPSRLNVFVLLDILQRKGKNTVVCDFVACPFTDNMQTRLKKLRLFIRFRNSKSNAQRGIC